MRRCKKKSLLQFWTFNIVLIVVVFYLLFHFALATWGVYKKYDFAKNKYDRLDLRAREMQDLKNKLENKLSDLETEFGKEKILRENYSYALSGEKLIIIKDLPNPDSSRINELKNETWFAKFKIFK